jgi:hypothetical protein
LKSELACPATLETVDVTAPTAVPTTLPIADLRAGFAVAFEAADFGWAACATPAALLRLPNAAFFFGTGASSLLRFAIAALAPVLDLDFAAAFFAIGTSHKTPDCIGERGNPDFSSALALLLPGQLR